MIFFFTGEERYLIDLKIEKWKKAFVQKYGSENIYNFGEGNFSVDRIQEVLLGGGLFDSKKFIIIKGAPKDSYTQLSSGELDKLFNFMEKYIDSFDKDNVIVFISYKPDKRTKFYKLLSKNNSIKLEEYKLFSEKQLISHIEKNFNLSNAMANYVIQKTGTNLFNIYNELEKILKVNDKITRELIDKYVNVNIEQNSFSLLDNLKNKDKTIKILYNLQANKEDFFKILGLLYWNIKNIILTLEQRSMGLSSKDIANKIGAHPFVVSKILNTNNDSKGFEKIFKKLINLDYSIKSGKIDSSLGYLYLKKIFLDIN